MGIEIKLVDGILPPSLEPHIEMFFQASANRLMVGHLRYGPHDARKLYVTRLRKELKAYVETGNFEHLVNISNYAFLESLAPQNKKLHFDTAAASATRDKLTR